MPTVSFVLPAYKATYLREAICSILSQTYKDFELIIVNDASPENVKKVVTNFHDERLRYYENDYNIGGVDLVKQWNDYCLPKAREEWIVMASDDDVYAPTYLEEMMKLTKKYPKCDLFHCRVKKINKYGEVIGISSPSAEFETCLDFISNRLCNHRLQTVQEFLFRRNAMLQIDGFVSFPLAFFTDDATWGLLSKNGVACCMQPLFMFRFSGINISSNKETSSRMLEKLKACFLYSDWMKNFLKDIECQDEQEKVFKLNIIRGLKNKQIEWINWTTCRVSFSDFLKIYMIKEYRTMCGTARWFILLLRNINERFFVRGNYN